MKKLALLLCLMVLGIQLIAQNNVIVSESNASFRVKNLGVAVNGQVRGMYGEVRLDQDSSFIQVTLDVRAIRTGIKMRDKHLMEERFFHKDQYPTMRFESDEVTRVDDGYLAKGNLTIKDVTQSIEVSFSGEENSFEGTFSINRKDFHVDNSDFISKGIADMVNITVLMQIDPEL